MVSFVYICGQKATTFKIFFNPTLLTLFYLAPIILFKFTESFSFALSNQILTLDHSFSSSDPRNLKIKLKTLPHDHSNNFVLIKSSADSENKSENIVNEYVDRNLKFEFTNSSNDDILYEDLSMKLINIINEQIEVPLDFGLIDRNIQILKEILRIQNLGISINFITENRIKELNNEYLGKNTSTDILAFPINNKREIYNPSNFTNKTKFLGDIFISPKYIQDKAESDLKEFEKQLMSDKNYATNERGFNRVFSTTYFSINSRLPLLIAHGLLHLMGYDHKSEQDYDEMVSKEEEILKSLDEKKDEFRITSSSCHYTIGVGTDICKVSRFIPLVRKFEPLLLRHICSTREKNYYNKYKESLIKRNHSTSDLIKWSSSFFAKRFAIKESASKALGTGLRYLSEGGIHLNDVELIHQKSGKPEIELKGLALKIANKLGVTNSFVSISDEDDIAFAFVTLVGSNFPQTST